MDSPVCGLAGGGSGGLCYWSCRASCRLLQMALLYVAVICLTWTFPPIYHRLSETRQAVVFTMVETAAAEMQQRAAAAAAAEGKAKATPGTSNNQTADAVKAPPPPAEIPPPPPPPDPTESASNRSYVVRAEPKVLDSTTEPPDLQPAVTAPDLEEPVALQEATATETVAANDSTEQPAEHQPQTEDIPSFSEWRLRHLAEDELKKRDQNNTASTASNQGRPGGGSKLRSKNYASPDCGAKIVAANPEATGYSSVLSPSRDEYLLNACTSRIWFVVELCEAIQAKKVDLANFELFSSSPREFSVYVSDRFPTRDWQNVGHFIAEDERTIQSFNLHPHLFGKFIKVELHSHYGSEHFCPVSLFRAYGTSEFEVLETVDQVLETNTELEDEDDDDDDEPLDVGKGEPSTIFDNARYAILSIVNKAAEALGKSGDAQNDTVVQNVTSNNAQISNIHHCKSPRHIVVCDNCSDSLFGDVFKLLSCQENSLEVLIGSSFISDSIRDSKLCSPYGLDFMSRRLGAPYPLKPKGFGQSDPGGYITALFPPKYIAALCNLLAVLERRVALNVSEQLSSSSVTSDVEEDNTSDIIEEHVEDVLQTTSTCTLNNNLYTQPCKIATDNSATVLTPPESASTDALAAQIKPTKTLEKVDEQEVPPSLLMASKATPGSEATVTEMPPMLETVMQGSTMVPTVVQDSNSTEYAKIAEPNEPSNATVIIGDIGQLGEESLSVGALLEEPSQDNLSLDSLLKELKDLERVVDSTSTSTVTTTALPPPSLPTQQQVQKESVFVRLANKIKALERNMSLSGQYLEELSKRYKKQVEDIQKSFNRTLTMVLEEGRKAEEREKRRMEEIVELKQQISVLSTTVETLVNDRNSWAATGYALMQPIFFIVVFAVMLHYLRHHADHTDLMMEDAHRKHSFGSKSKKGSKLAENRRRSVEGVSGHETQKLKRRRPSEETLVSGSYHELLLPENQVTETDGGVRTVPKIESKKRRRKKRDSVPKSVMPDQQLEVLRCETRISEPLIPSYRSPELPEVATVTNGLPPEDKVNVNSGGIVSVLGSSCTVLENVQPSADEETSTKIVDKAVKKSESYDSGVHKGSASVLQLEVGDLNKEGVSKLGLSESVPILGQNNGSVKQQGLSPRFRQLSAPLFMKTAMAARSGRRSAEQSPTAQAKLKSDNWEWYSSRKSGAVPSHSSPVSQTVLNVNGNGVGRTSEATTSDLVHKDSNNKKQAGGLKKIGNWRIQSLFKN